MKIKSDRNRDCKTEEDIDFTFTCVECVIMLIGCILIRWFFCFSALAWGLEGWKRILMKKFYKEISIEELRRKIDEL